MTSKEAIEIVKTFRNAMDNPMTEYRDILLGALDMAIIALHEKDEREQEQAKMLDDMDKEYNDEERYREEWDYEMKEDAKEYLAERGDEE